jgi:putative transposase
MVRRLLRELSVMSGSMSVMSRHTTFRFCLDPTAEQQSALARHAGAARFAFNQCLRLHLEARAARRCDASVKAPWTGFDLINAFNEWKRSETAGRVISVDGDGTAEVMVTGLAWRSGVCQQVFEEASVDAGKALRAWADSRGGKRAGRKAGHPRFKKKDRSVASFRVRNKHPNNTRPTIRVGDTATRSVTLPGIGTTRVHDDTRRLRRLLAKGRAKVLFATVSYRAGRWWVSLNVEASDLHPDQRHAVRSANDRTGWVGVDRGLSALVVAATGDGTEVARVADPPKPLAAGIRRQQHLARAVSRKSVGSKNRRKAISRLARHHHRVANIRKHFLHHVANELVKTHDRLAIEDLNVSGMLRNQHLARAISDAGWAELARLLVYKQAWRHGTVIAVDRWFASSKTCSACGIVKPALPLADRSFQCGSCGNTLDRDLNAAINLAIWAEKHHALARDPQAGGPVTNAHRQEGTGSHPSGSETGLEDVGTDVRTVSTA